MKLLLLIPLFVGVFAHAAPELMVHGGYIFIPLKGTNATAGYAMIHNPSDKKVTLSIASAAGFKAAELHESISENGLNKMRKVESVSVDPSGMFEFKPGGHHIMLFDATKEYKIGDVVQVEFKVDGKKQSFPFEIRARDAAAPEHHHH